MEKLRSLVYYWPMLTIIMTMLVLLPFIVCTSISIVCTYFDYFMYIYNSNMTINHTEYVHTTLESDHPFKTECINVVVIDENLNMVGTDE